MKNNRYSWRERLGLVWIITRKDVIDAVKNQYLVLGLLMPVFLSLLFRVMFPSMDISLRFTVALVDQGNSQMAASLRANPEITVLDKTTQQQVMETVRGKAVGGLVIPVGFDADVAAGKQPELPVYIDNRRGGGERNAFLTLVNEEVWKLAGHKLPLARLATLDAYGPENTQGFANLNMSRFILVMLLVLTITGAGVFVVPTLLVEEREKRTLKALLVSPAGPGEVVAGKALTGLIYCLVVAAAILLLNQGWTGSFLVTCLAILVGSIFMVLFGLLIGSLLTTITQVNTWTSVVLILFLLPSWLPMVSLPAPFNLIERLIPTYYLVDALNQSVDKILSPASIAINLAVISGCALLSFALVVWQLKREERV